MKLEILLFFSFNDFIGIGVKSINLNIYFYDKIKQRGWAKTSKAAYPRRRAITAKSSTILHSKSKRKTHKEPRIKEEKPLRTLKEVLLIFYWKFSSKKQRNLC